MLSSLCVHLTNLCNLNCSHCWSDSGPFGKEIVNFESLIEFVDYAKVQGLSRISLSGGEPLLYPHIKELIEALTNREISMVITINGVQRDRVASFSRFIERCGADIEIRVSVYGPELIHDRYRGDGSFKRTMRSIELLNARRHRMCLNVVVAEYNESENNLWKEFLNVCVALGFSEIALIPLTRRGRGRFLAGDCGDHSILANWCVAELRRIGFLERVVIWDYNSTDNAYVLIESNGEIILPGVIEENDIRVGELGTFNLNPAAVFREIENKKRIFTYGENIEI